MAFQRKCMGRMREVGRSGCTVLFVSHNMPAVESLCTRALLLDGGRLVQDGDVRELIGEYHRRMLTASDGGVVVLADWHGPDRKLKVFHAATLLDEQGRPTNFLPLGGAFQLRLTLDSPRPIPCPTITLGIDDNVGQRMLSLCTPVTNPILDRIEGHRVLDCQVAAFPLAPEITGSSSVSPRSAKNWTPWNGPCVSASSMAMPSAKAGAFIAGFASHPRGGGSRPPGQPR